MNEYDRPLDQGGTLRELFGDNRAEWPSESFREIFVPPAYVQKLESIRPSILVGGRGTGKTTSLQSLRYEETLQRLVAEGQSFGDQEYLGILIRINKNRVHAFQGGGASAEIWVKAFSHYINLLICFELAKLGQWLEGRGESGFSEDCFQQICMDLAIDDVGDFISLQRAIRGAISKLQIFVNNPSSDLAPLFSMQEAPVRSFVELLRDSGLMGGRVVFCCFDEYENLLDSQQAILNTYIKHSEPPISYKVGVRKNGLRCRQTLNKDDLLRTPDDYAEIEIADEGFEFFATAVANTRLEYAVRKGISVPNNVSDFLENLSQPDEAMLLGGGRVAEEVISEVCQKSDALAEFLKDKPLSDVYFLKYWSEKDGSSVVDLAEHWKENETAWSTRIGNHRYASLFWLSKGRKGARIRKYYSGLKAVLSVSAGNIRYFLEVIDDAIKYEIEANSFEFPSKLILSAKSQTLALRDVGRKRLDQLEGLADYGVQLKRLVLGVGKTFFELNRSATSQAPEVNSFILSGDPDDIGRVSTILMDGVAHLALEAAPATKLTSDTELRVEEYRLHRIFSGFFEISYRKKRRTTFNARDLLSLIEDQPSKAINNLLGGQQSSTVDDLPEQLAFFSSFYDGTGGES